MGENSATIDFHAAVELSAEVTYGDEATHWYDHEDKKGGYFDHISRTIKRVIDVPAEATISFADDATEFDVIELKVNRGRSVDLSFYDEERY